MARLSPRVGKQPQSKNVLPDLIGDLENELDYAYAGMTTMPFRCSPAIPPQPEDKYKMDKPYKILSLALAMASFVLGGQVAHAGNAEVSISSVGNMSDDTGNDTGFVLDIPKIFIHSSTLPKGGFFATTSRTSFNANATVDCAVVIDNNDGSHDIILSGSTKDAAEFGSLVPPGVSQFNLVNNQYYGRVNINAAGILSRSNFPSEFEGCAFSGEPGEPQADVLPAGFPTGSTEFCNEQNFKNVNWITCKQLKGKSMSVLENSYGLGIDRKMNAGITIFP